jgi:hypothetical protein
MHDVLPAGIHESVHLCMIGEPSHDAEILSDFFYYLLCHTGWRTIHCWSETEACPFLNIGASCTSSSLIVHCHRRLSQKTVHCKTGFLPSSRRKRQWAPIESDSMHHQGDISSDFICNCSFIMNQMCMEVLFLDWDDGLEYFFIDAWESTKIC